MNSYAGGSGGGLAINPPTILFGKWEGHKGYRESHHNGNAIVCITRSDPVMICTRYDDIRYF
jgi:hypothetical protein